MELGRGNEREGDGQERRERRRKGVHRATYSFTCSKLPEALNRRLGGKVERQRERWIERDIKEEREREGGERREIRRERDRGIIGGGERWRDRRRRGEMEGS